MPVDLTINIHPQIFSIPEAKRRFHSAFLPLKMAQCHYDGWSSFYIPFKLWFHIAVLTWSEELFTPDPGGYTQPMFLTGHKLAPFQGMKEGAEDSHNSAVEHGKGMSSFIKYMAFNNTLLGAYTQE